MTRGRPAKTPAIEHKTKMVNGQEIRTCGLEWCDTKMYSRGYCANHYERLRKGYPIVDPRTKVKHKCAYELCDRDAATKGYCNTHYVQKWSGKELKPIRPRREVAERPGERQCKTCNLWLDRDADFYKHSNPGSRQNECKKCQGKRSRRNDLIRQGRHEEAALI